MTAFRYTCPACQGSGEVESQHPDVTLREPGTCAVCMGLGTVTLRTLELHDARMADYDDSYVPPVRTLTPDVHESINTVDLLDDPWALAEPVNMDDPWTQPKPPTDDECREALTALYGEEEATRLMTLEPPC